MKNIPNIINNFVQNNINIIRNNYKQSVVELWKSLQEIALEYKILNPNLLEYEFVEIEENIIKLLPIVVNNMNNVLLLMKELKEIIKLNKILNQVQKQNKCISQSSQLLFYRTEVVWYTIFKMEFIKNDVIDWVIRRKINEWDQNDGKILRKKWEQQQELFKYEWEPEMWELSFDIREYAWELLRKSELETILKVSFFEYELTIQFNQIWNELEEQKNILKILCE
jgi:hypothetical protein